MATTVDARRETASLIGSDKVEGTPVYGDDDRKIGTMHTASARARFHLPTRVVHSEQAP
jgi:hypothetical protein